MASPAQAPADAEGLTSHTPNPDQPTVYQAMNMVMRDVRNVGKDGHNSSQNYSFRGVDDVIGALAQPMRDHGVFMTPEVLDFQSEVRGRMNAVRMRIAFHFYGPAGDSVRAVTLGEAADVADKASNKAMSAALKYALVHTFMIPVDAGSLDDGDRDHPAGHRSAADAFVERLRKPHVWHNPAALAAMHAEAKTEGQLNVPVEDPNGGTTTLGELIVTRGKQLKAEAQEREARRAEEAPQVAAQVAAEHGASVPTAAEPERHDAGQSAAQEGPPSADSPETAELDKLVEQAREHWDTPKAHLVLGQIKGAAEHAGLLDHNVEGPWGWEGFGAILNRRLKELEQNNSDGQGAAA